MKKNATFYLMNNDNTEDNLSSIEQLVCHISAEFWRKEKYVFIFCENEQQAVRIDETLWKKPTESFVPHNIVKTGPINKFPIEISWLQKSNNKKKQDILINLFTAFPDIANNFIKIVDFVPYKESLKKLARKRYNAYRIAGFELNTIKIENNEKEI